MTLTDSGLGERRARVTRFVRPIQEFIQTEAAGGAIMLAAAMFALLWANSPWSHLYHELVEHHIVLDLGFYRIDESLHFWVNDAAMVLFFFVVGLEIKREAVVGELASFRRMILPVAGAAGGMLVPAAIFLAFAAGEGAEAARGWGIPVATDIAFAVGVLTLLGRRIPAAAKIWLLAIASADDVGGIIVIGVFYAAEVNFTLIGVAVAMLVLAWAMRRNGLWYLPLYFATGIVAWAAVVKSGVHPSLVGVAFGLLTPWQAWYRPAAFMEMAERTMRRVRHEREPGEHHDPEGHDDHVDALLTLSQLSRHSVAPLDRLEHELQPLVAFAIVPLFAFVNAGVTISGDTLGEAATSPIMWGITLGLVLGKPLGIMSATWLAARLGARLPSGVRWRTLAGISVLGGIGFTVSLLIGDLAYADEEMLTFAKLGIFAGSFLAGIVGIRGRAQRQGRSTRQGFGRVRAFRVFDRSGSGLTLGSGRSTLRPYGRRPRREGSPPLPCKARDRM
jgi:NhaA family Na+:H+ antiporter